MNNPLIYTDPTGQTIVGDFFKWVKKNTWDEFWDAANNFAKWADQNGIPAAGYGYNSSLGTYHYLGNSGNVYHSQVRGMNNAPQVTENAVIKSRQGTMSSFKRTIGYGDNTNLIFPNNANDPFIDIEFSLSAGIQGKTKLKIFGLGGELSGNLAKIDMMNWSAASNKKGITYTPYKSIVSSIKYGANGLFGGYKFDWAQEKGVPVGQLGMLEIEKGKGSRIVILDIGNAFFCGYDLKVTASPAKVINTISIDQIERINRINHGDYSMWAYPRFGGRIF